LGRRLVFAIALSLLCANPARAERAPAPKLAYLNVSDGTTSLRAATEDNAAEDLSAIGSVIPYPPFEWASGPEGKSVSAKQATAYLIFALHKAFLPYNLIWTDVRPAADPYTMVMVGGRPEQFGFDPRVAGAALMDCDNLQENNVVFAFPSPLPGNLHGLFVTAAQETAHAFGLEHTEDRNDLMNAQVGPYQWTFTDRSNPISAPRACGPLLQNSHQKLAQILGLWPLGVPKPLGDGTVPDVSVPQITIRQPANGQVVSPSFELVVSVVDESPLAEVSVQSPAGSQIHANPPRILNINSKLDLEPGAAKVFVWARDANGNQSFASVEVIVEEANSGAIGCSYAASHLTRRGKTTGGALAIFVLILAWGTCRRVLT
jgi:hypothetical protein